MIVAIGGPIGVGKSTVARLLADRLGSRYISAGEGFREAAHRRGLSVIELNRLAEREPEIDREVDRLQADLAREGPSVVESRLSGWMVDAQLKVWLRAPFRVRAARVAQRERISVEEAERDLRAREESEWSRYRQLYGIDVDDLSPYHVVLDTAYWPPEEIADALVHLARTMAPGGEAGARAHAEGERR